MQGTHDAHSVLGVQQSVSSITLLVWTMKDEGEHGQCLCMLGHVSPAGATAAAAVPKLAMAADSGSLPVLNVHDLDIEGGGYLQVLQEGQLRQQPRRQLRSPKQRRRPSLT